MPNPKQHRRTAAQRRQVAHNNAGRKVGYRIWEAAQPEHRSRVILWLYPISGHSLVLEYAAPSLRDYRASVICVDRPGLGDTDLQPKATTTTDSESSSAVWQRLACHADDVLAVLAQYPEITHVYLMAICIGHAYAMEVARRLLLLEQQPDQTMTTTTHQQHAEPQPPPPPPLHLAGLTLVAPFVSTACPDSWRVARLGSHVPSCVLTHCMAPVASYLTSHWILPLVLTPSTVQRLVAKPAQEPDSDNGDDVQDDYYYTWTEADCGELCQLATRIHREQSSGPDQAMEVLLGTDPSWQHVCDEFAALWCATYPQYHPSNDHNHNSTDQTNHVPATDGIGTTTTSSDSTSKSRPVFPIIIRASRHDKVAPLSSIQWLLQRCYNNDPNMHLHLENGIANHEVMTFLGGPPHNPVLLHQIAAEWGLR